MPKYSFQNENISTLINNAVESVLKKGFRTKDILNKNDLILSTDEMGEKVLEELKNEKI